MSEPPMVYPSPSCRTRLLLLRVWCYRPTTATSAAEAQQRYKQGLALWTELVNTKRYTWKHLLSTEPLEMVKWLQNLRKAGSLMSHVFFSPTLTTGKQTKNSVGVYIILPSFQPHSSSVCRTSGCPPHVFQHLTFPKRRLKNATFLRY